MLCNLGTLISRILNSDFTPPDDGGDPGAFILRANGASFLLLSNQTSKLKRA